MSKLDSAPVLRIERGSPAADCGPLSIQFQITEDEQVQLIESITEGESVLSDREETLDALLEDPGERS